MHFLIVEFIRVGTKKAICSLDSSEIRGWSERLELI